MQKVKYKFLWLLGYFIFAFVFIGFVFFILYKQNYEGAIPSEMVRQIFLIAGLNALVLTAGLAFLFYLYERKQSKENSE